MPRVIGNFLWCCVSLSAPNLREENSHVETSQKMKHVIELQHDATWCDCEKNKTAYYIILDYWTSLIHINLITRISVLRVFTSEVVGLMMDRCVAQVIAVFGTLKAVESGSWWLQTKCTTLPKLPGWCSLPPNWQCWNLRCQIGGICWFWSTHTQLEFSRPFVLWGLDSWISFRHTKRTHLPRAEQNHWHCYLRQIAFRMPL